MKKQLLQLGCCALLANLAFAANPKISRDLEGADPLATGDVIVQFAHAPTETHHRMVRGHGGSFRSELPLVKSAVYSISNRSLKSLAADPEVVYISPNRRLSGSMDNAAAAVNAQAAWKQSLTGAGIGVALIDSGVAMGQDVTGYTVLFGQSWVNYTIQDLYGHGTAVAGIIAGSGAASHAYGSTRNLQGIAPGAKIVNFRVLDQKGMGTDANVIAAINTAILLKWAFNIRVINL